MIYDIRPSFEGSTLFVPQAIDAWEVYRMLLDAFPMNLSFTIASAGAFENAILFEVDYNQLIVR